LNKLESWKQFIVKIVHPKIDEIAKSVAKQDRFACKAGCAWCCHQGVSAGLHEAAALLDVIPLSQRQTLKKSLIEFRQRFLANGRDPAKTGRCLFLGADQRCTVYDARPLACRSYFSRNAEICRNAVAEPHSTPCVDVVISPTSEFDVAAAKDGLGVYELATAVLHLMEPRYKPLKQAIPAHIQKAITTHQAAGAFTDLKPHRPRCITGCP
jgi:Fe-S-cluster containining protein